jgi:hypothetical protein
MEERGVWFRTEGWESFLLEIFVYCAAFVVGRVIAIAQDAADFIKSFFA